MPQMRSVCCVPHKMNRENKWYDYFGKAACVIHHSFQEVQKINVSQKKQRPQSKQTHCLSLFSMFLA